MWLDGQRVAALSRTLDLDVAPVARMQIGDNSASRTFEVAFDDVSVDEVATVVVQKAAASGGPQQFDFSGDAPLGSFSLADGGQKAQAVAPGTYDVTEGPEPAGWEATGATCSDDDDPTDASTVAGRTATVRARAGETVTCTFESGPSSVSPRRCDGEGRSDPPAWRARQWQLPEPLSLNVRPASGTKRQS